MFRDNCYYREWKQHVSLSYHQQNEFTVRFLGETVVIEQ